MSPVRKSLHRPVSGVLMALALVIAACDSGQATTATVSSAGVTTTAGSAEGPTPVIVDYSPTVSDVGGLMYLLSESNVEVIAISLPGTGEAGCDLGVEVTLGILAMFEREDIPVACDPEIPDGARDWPEEFLAGHENLAFGLPASTATMADLSAPDLIAEAAADSDRPVVLYAVAPLTNVANALNRHPELAEDLERVVIMGGAVDAPGNVSDSSAEWNIWIDVPSAAAVVASGVPVTLVPLDATNSTPVPSIYQRLLDDADQSDAIVYLSKMVRTFPQVTSGFWYFWDELAAAVAAGAAYVGSEEMRIVVVQGGANDGRTARDDSGYPTTVAVSVADPNALYADFLSTLAGSPVEVGRQATAAEKEYLKSVESSLSTLEAVFESVFNDPALQAAFSGGAYDGPGVAAALDRFFSGIATSYEAASQLDPPPSLRDVHDNLIQVLELLVGKADEIVTTAATVETLAALEEVISDLPDIADGCDPISEEAAFLGVDIELFC